MEIHYPPELIRSLNQKHLLLDTNVFIDFALKPTIFNQFFTTLQENDVTLVTIEFVKYELLKGSADKEKYQEKEKLINEIVDFTLPLDKKDHFMYELIQKYGIDGKAISLTDLFLGATLMQYKPNLFLMTRDTTDFMQHIFTMPYVVNIPHKKGIFTYGIYHYKNSV